MSLYEDFGPDGWGPVRRSICRGEFVEPARFVGPLKGNQPIPSEVRTYLADFLGGEITPPRGRPSNHRKSYREEADWAKELRKAIHPNVPPRAIEALSHAQELYLGARQRGEKLTRDAAISLAAEKYEMDFDLLRNHHNRGRAPRRK